MKKTTAGALFVGNTKTLPVRTRCILKNKKMPFKIVLDFCPRVRGEETVLRHLSNLLSSGKGSDVDFIVLNNKISAHSFILVGGSPVFAAMFELDMTESSSRTVVVDDIEPTVFRQLLHYLYTGDIPCIEVKGTTEQLFIAADKYHTVALCHLKWALKSANPLILEQPLKRTIEDNLFLLFFLSGWTKKQVDSHFLVAKGHCAGEGSQRLMQFCLI